MFVSDQLVFTELHKTGGSHILRCLEKVLDGRRVGKHNRVPESLRDRFVIGSVRNPWDWYVSLWGYGCSAQGGVHARMTQRYDFPYYWRQLNKEMGQTWLKPSQYLRQFVADTFKPVNAWQDSYADTDDPARFRQWLKMLLSPERRFDVGEGFGFSPVSAHSGLLTYRYLKLFTGLNNKLYTSESLLDRSSLSRVFRDNTFVNFVIRNEYLEADLIAALEEAELRLTDDQKNTIQASKLHKTNTSKRKNVEYYFDQETTDLVKQRESLIIALHDYQPPQI